MGVVLGRDHVRIEGTAKVTGAALYSSDGSRAEEAGRLAHAALVTSTVAKGRIIGFDRSAAEAMPGLLGLFTHRDFAGAVAPVAHLMAGGYANSSHRPLESDAVAYAGQIVALVVAETVEIAAAAAASVVSPMRSSPHPPDSTHPAPRPFGWPTSNLITRIFARVMPQPPSPPRSTGSRHATRRRRSTIIRSSCSPPAAPGTATRSPCMSRPASSAPCSTGSRRNWGSIRRKCAWSRG